MTTEKIYDNEWIVFDDWGFKLGNLVYEDCSGSYTFYPKMDMMDIGLNYQELLGVMELMDA